jgi:hypothetical protein
MTPDVIAQLGEAWRSPAPQTASARRARSDKGQPMTSQQQPPQTIMHPPWRRMAEVMLREKDPEKYRQLKESGSLVAHLDAVSEQARLAYESTVRQIEEQNPGKGSWALQSAQEIVTRDVLDPTT